MKEYALKSNEDVIKKIKAYGLDEAVVLFGKIKDLTPEKLLSIFTVELVS